MGRLKMGPKNPLNPIKASQSKEGAVFKQPVDLSSVKLAMAKDYSIPVIEMPVDRVVEVIKEVPVEVIREVEKRIEIPVEVIKYQQVEVIKEIEVRVEVPVEIVKEVQVVEYRVPKWAHVAVAIALLETIIVAVMLAIK